MVPGDIEHCAAKIAEIVGRGVGDPRALLQLGYNLGRLSELTGRGRGPFWDRWKDAAVAWDVPRLAELARQLQGELGDSGDRAGGGSGAS